MTSRLVPRPTLTRGWRPLEVGGAEADRGWGDCAALHWCCPHARGRGGSHGLSTCRSRTSRASTRTRPGRVPCTPPTTHSAFSLHFLQRRPQSSSAAGPPSERRLQGPSLPRWQNPAPGSPLALAAGELRTEIYACSRIPRGLGASCHGSLGLSVLPAGPPVELAGRKLSTINKAKISALGLSLQFPGTFFPSPQWWGVGGS